LVFAAQDRRHGLGVEFIIPEVDIVKVDDVKNQRRALRRSLADRRARKR
jgi:hypothetical protein